MKQIRLKTQNAISMTSWRANDAYSLLQHDSKYYLNVNLNPHDIQYLPKIILKPNLIIQF